jgi:hypothetical protein
MNFKKLIAILLVFSVITLNPGTMSLVNAVNINGNLSFNTTENNSTNMDTNSTEAYKWMQDRSARFMAKNTTIYKKNNSTPYKIEYTSTDMLDIGDILVLTTEGGDYSLYELYKIGGDIGNGLILINYQDSYNHIPTKIYYELGEFENSYTNVCLKLTNKSEADTILKEFCLIEEEIKLTKLIEENNNTVKIYKNDTQDLIDVTKELEKSKAANTISTILCSVAIVPYLIAMISVAYSFPPLGIICTVIGSGLVFFGILAGEQII